jgi:hypothetical protein
MSSTTQNWAEKFRHHIPGTSITCSSFDPSEDLLWNGSSTVWIDRFPNQSMFYYRVKLHHYYILGKELLSSSIPVFLVIILPPLLKYYHLNMEYILLDSKTVNALQDKEL